MLFKHHAATSSRSVGSSSAVPVLLTRLDTGHMRRRSSAAGLRSSMPASPFSHGPISALSSTTGMRSWIGRVSALASVTMMVHEVMGSPVSGFFHLSQRAAKLSTLPTAALMKYGCLPSGPSASRWTAGQSVTRLLTLDYCVANNQWSAKNTFAVR